MHTFSDPTPNINGGFGGSLDIAGNLVAIGAPSFGAPSEGEVHIFDAVSGVLLQTIPSQPTPSGGFFGVSIDLDGTNLLVGTSNAGAFLYSNASTVNEPPTADAGANQSIHAGQLVTLDGSGSSDDQTSTVNLIYDWSLAIVPPGSSATLNGATTISPSFIADLPGDYIISLVVTDEAVLSSLPASVTVSSLNTPPTANAGLDKGVIVGNLVTLDGSKSNDADFDVVRFSWVLISKPVGSSSDLAGSNTVFPSFVPDLPGNYVAQLVVNDGLVDSTPAQVTISVVTPQAFAETSAMDVINAIAALPIDNFRKKGDQKSFSKRMSKVIKELQKGAKKVLQELEKGDVQKAEKVLAKANRKASKELVKAIERTDGCALRGSPDTGAGPGPNPRKDDITTCDAQATIYQLLVNALNALAP